MPEEPIEPGPPIHPDIRTIRQLVRLMQRYDLTAIDLGEGEHKIRLRRRGADVPAVPAPVVPAPLAMPAPALAPSPAPAAKPAPPPGVVIESPMIGTFYTSPP